MHTFNLVLLLGSVAVLVAGQAESYTVTFSKPTTFATANSNTLFANGVSPALPLSQFTFSAARGVNFESGQPDTKPYLTTPFSIIRPVDVYSSELLLAMTTSATFPTVNVRSSQNANKGYTFTGVQVVGYQHQKQDGIALEQIQLSSESLQVNYPMLTGTGVDQVRWDIGAAA
ncbi:hypothetical protein P152DRAFT_475526 [Eremomyces bilateralis CBS 781.70]|uniref:Uncharacterized protein n=1 Tax=Eremomyces bilateralis CBS 781.70 TaxID=1392243 RepID=A0A6G1FXU1_9PEZI|nr:uncharacterized protein P152DRAFT_475526 [Eremomyces bilateralis CBS 781.70]KAF1810705.1 hypothetical protein P152DRAFT_475526 [Eremomyces bilateralis CBS 781.70]